MYIVSSSLISQQKTFENNGFSDHIDTASLQEDIVHPDYKDIIPPMERRRMTDAVKMSLACAKSCLEKANVSEPGAIIIGTSMGSSQHTKKFLDSIITSEGGLISPTPFIQSTHNTIAGQISLFLKNNRYNNTHTQNCLSFEHALYDALILNMEGIEDILVGSADEREDTLFDLNAYLGSVEEGTPGAGASFFLTSSNKGPHSVRLVDIELNSLVEDKEMILSRFLSRNGLLKEAPDLLLYATRDGKRPPEIEEIPADKKINYVDLCGKYMTSSGFGFGYAVDQLVYGKQNIRSVMIYNNMSAPNLGLILLEKP